MGKRAKGEAPSEDGIGAGLAAGAAYNVDLLDSHAKMAKWLQESMWPEIWMEDPLMVKEGGTQVGLIA